MIDVATALLGIVPLLIFAIPQTRTQSHQTGSVLGDFKLGLRYVAARPGFVMLFAIIGLVVLTVMPTFTMTPLLVKQHFGGGVNEVAFMEALAGVGIILGGVLMTVWRGFSKRIVTMMVSFVVSCGTVALTALSPSNALWLAAAWWFLSGATFSTGNVPFTTIIQTQVPNEMQGRVLSLMSTVMGLAGPIGLVIAGPLGEAIGVRGVFVVGGVLSALVCALALLSKRLREIES
jgi:DHA3 family macrolide efflux protein-like MFS transporter